MEGHCSIGQNREWAVVPIEEEEEEEEEVWGLWKQRNNAAALLY